MAVYVPKFDTAELDHPYSLGGGVGDAAQFGVVCCAAEMSEVPAANAVAQQAETSYYQNVRMT